MNVAAGAPPAGAPPAPSPARPMPAAPAVVSADDVGGIQTGLLPPDTLTFSNLPTWITYLRSLALFIVGVLTSTGVVVPAGTSGMIKAVTGGAVTAASLIVALVSQLSHHSVQKAAINSPTTVVALPAIRSLKVKTRELEL